MARPRKLVDPHKVEALAAEGCTAAEIAACLGCQVDLIEKRFPVPVQVGRQKLHRFLKHQLVKLAKAGNTSAIIFALKAYAGLRDTDPMNLTVTAQATAAGIVISEEQKKELYRTIGALRHRAFKDPLPHNGDSIPEPALN